MLGRRKLLWSVAKAFVWSVVLVLVVHYLALAWYDVRAKTFKITKKANVSRKILATISTIDDMFAVTDDYSKYEEDPSGAGEDEDQDFNVSMSNKLTLMISNVTKPLKYSSMDKETSCRCVLASSACPKTILDVQNYDSFFWNSTFSSKDASRSMEIPLLTPNHCKLKIYNDLDVKSCFEAMGKDDSTSRNFLFMGDAKIRDVFTAFLEATKTLDYSVNFNGDRWTNLEKFLKPLPQKPHQKIQAQSKLLGTYVRLKHYWAPWLGVHAKNQLKAILQMVKAKGGRFRGLAPAFVVIGFGAFMTSSVHWQNASAALEQEGSLLRTYRNALREVEQPVKQLSSEIPVIWALPWPAMMQAKKFNKRQQLLESRNSLGQKLVTTTRRSFKGSNVIIWDTSWAIQKASNEQCHANAHSQGQKGKTKKARCSDLNSDALHQLAQVLLNFVCNRHSSIINESTSKAGTNQQSSSDFGLCCQ